MNHRLSLFVCPRDLARRAIERWHYSKTMPAAGLDLYGIREGQRFVGVVVFGMGANPRLAAPFGLAQGEVRELVRVALCDQRRQFTSAVLAACLKRFHHERPQVRLCISYADPLHGHIGTLYQAGNWSYLGRTQPARTLIVEGRRRHPRSLYQRFGTSSLRYLRAQVDPDATAAYDPPKHKYALAFDGQLRRRLRRLSCPYPRPAVKESRATRPATSGEGHVQSVLTAPDPDAFTTCMQSRTMDRYKGES